MSVFDDDADDGPRLERPPAYEDSAGAEDIVAASAFPPLPSSLAATGDTVTCSRLLASSPNEALFLRLLPKEVIDVVDNLMEVNAWRCAGRLVYAHLPRGLCDYQGYLVDQQGHEVLVRNILTDDPDVRHHSGVCVCVYIACNFLDVQPRRWAPL